MWQRGPYDGRLKMGQSRKDCVEYETAGGHARTHARVQHQPQPQQQQQPRRRRPLQEKESSGSRRTVASPFSSLAADESDSGEPLVESSRAEAGAAHGRAVPECSREKRGLFYVKRR